jgi:hypothetical protein
LVSLKREIGLLTGSTILEDRYRLPASIAEAPPGQFVSHETASLLVNWLPVQTWDTTVGAHWRSREGFQTEANDPRAKAGSRAVDELPANRSDCLGVAFTVKFDNYLIVR